MHNALKIAIIVMVPFVLFISVATVYQSSTGMNILTGEKTGDSAKEWAGKQFEKIQSPISNLDSTSSSNECQGNAQCISGIITAIIDGDTVKVNGKSIRFALVDAPKLKYDGGQAREFIEQVCPVGSTVVVDQDDSQLEDKYGRMLGVIYCNNLNLNKELLDSGLGDLYSAFCDQSEFSTQSWAQKHGCITENNSSESTIQQQITQNNCEPSYPDFCIPTYPPDLDCGDISQKKFTVLQPDPHGFDGDEDGIGCE